jgi:EAL domain-containing protein (putative c-di-GMP-specific phosphodiesterase class I)
LAAAQKTTSGWATSSFVCLAEAPPVILRIEREFGKDVDTEPMCDSLVEHM